MLVANAHIGEKAMPKSYHDQERDRVAAYWPTLLPFTCAGCKEVKTFPAAARIEIEVRYDGQLRADVAAINEANQVIGVVEVVFSHPPTDEALEAQGLLGFAYYGLLPKARGNEPIVWLCSPDCWSWYARLPSKETSSPWEAPRCDGCGGYFHQNSISQFEFRDWSDDPHYAYCIHCAAAYDGQWRTPGELAGGDPREWTPDDNADPVVLFFAYSEAKFWAMVWTKRITDPKMHDGRKNEAVENATAMRLPLVCAAFDAGEWAKGANLLLPIGCPGWQSFPDEPERLLAFTPDNCVGAALAWNRLLGYRLEQLPDELTAVIRLLPQPNGAMPLDDMSNHIKEQAQEAITRRQEARSKELEKEQARRESAEAKRQQEEAARENQKREWQEFNEWFMERRPQQNDRETE